DLRIPARAADITSILAAVLLRVARANPSSFAGTAASLAAVEGLAGQAAGDPRIARGADDLLAHRGAGIVICGARQSPAAQTLAQLLNGTLGNPSRTTWFTPSPLAHSDAGTLTQLTERLRAGEIRSLLVVGGNPAYTAPADLEFADLVRRVELSGYCGL